MDTGLDGLFDRLWRDFVALNPEARRVADLLAVRGDRIVHDHIALYTFDHPKLGIDASARVFEAHGYRARAEHELPEHKLYTRHYESDDPRRPQVFISELRLGECTRGLRDIVGSLVRQFDPAQLAPASFVIGGTPWNPVMHEVHERLHQESAHAAWVATFGFRAHHFALSVSALGSFGSLGEFNTFLESHGFELDDAEDEGTPAALLQCSATPPAPCPLRFADGMADVPGNHCEFAWRHPRPDDRPAPDHLAANDAGPEPLADG